MLSGTSRPVENLFSIKIKIIAEWCHSEEDCEMRRNREDRNSACWNCHQVYVTILFFVSEGRSQWPRGLRHELSSPAGTMGSWVRIPLKTWMSVRVYSVCAVLCVGRGLARGWSPVQGVVPAVYKIHSSRLILMGKQTRGADTKGREEEDDNG
jgi:hypothetical protein